MNKPALTMSSNRNKQASNRKQTGSDVADERHDRVTPHWRSFYNGHCWPAWRLDRCSLDELRRLQIAVPYLQSAIDQAIFRKELAR